MKKKLLVWIRKSWVFEFVNNLKWAQRCRDRWAPIDVRQWRRPIGSLNVTAPSSRFATRVSRVKTAECFRVTRRWSERIHVTKTWELFRMGALLSGRRFFVCPIARLATLRRKVSTCGSPLTTFLSRFFKHANKKRLRIFRGLCSDDIKSNTGFLFYLSFTF